MHTLLTSYRDAPLKNFNLKYLSYEIVLHENFQIYGLILLIVAGQCSHHPHQFLAMIDTLYTDYHIQSTHHFLPLPTKYSENAVIVGSFLFDRSVFVSSLFLCSGYLDSCLYYCCHFYRSLPVLLSLNTEVSEL